MSTQSFNAAQALVRDLTDTEWNTFVKLEQNRRTTLLNAAGPIAVGTKVKLSSEIRPKRIAGRTGTVIEVKFYSNKWTHKVRLDGTGEVFIRIERKILTEVDESEYVPAGMKKKPSGW